MIGHVLAEPPKVRVRHCDHLLNELEELNLRNQASLPLRLGQDLRHVGLDDPYSWSVSELIERVLELQDQSLTLLRKERNASSRLQLYSD